MSAQRGEDARAQREGVCGVTRLVGDTEFICIARTHDDPPRPGHGQRSQRPHFGYYPKSERHYYVNKYPYREG